MDIHRMDTHHDPYEVWEVLRAASGDLAFDVGVNIGQSTRVLANGFRRVVAFEPNPDSFIIMKDEMPANVLPLQFAVTSYGHRGTVQLDVASMSMTTGQYVTGEGLRWGDLLDTVEVAAMSLDYAADHHGFPEFVKIDTEGHEVEVVRGGQRVFARHPKVVIEIHKMENEAQVRELMPEYEWTKVVHPPRIRDPFLRDNHFWLVSQ